MPDPWDDDVVVGDPWDEDSAVNDVVPAASKSERTLRDLSMFGGRFDPVAVGETALTAGTGIANEILRGLTGIAGTAVGMVPGGESPNEKANKWMDAIDITYEPRTHGGEAGVEGLGKGMGKVVEGVKYIGSGYRGMAELAAGAGTERAVESMGEFKDTDQALGEGVFAATESPTLAAVAQLLPEIASLGVPVKKIPKTADAPNIAPDMPPSGFGGVGAVDDVAETTARAIPETGPGGRPLPDQPDAGAFDRLRDAIRRGDKQAVLEEVNANPAIVAAFEQLGIEFTPAMVSDNAALRQIEAGMASRADSGLTQAQELVEFKLNDRAQQLVDDAGGKSGDPATTAADIETRYNEIHGDYLKAEEVIWDELNTKVPRGTEIDVRQMAETLEETANRLGKGDVDLGLSRMSKHEKELWRLTHAKDADGVWVYDQPPWEAIDRFRRRLGLGLENRGPFNDAELGEIKNWYGQVAEQQARFAQGNGYGADWERMNQLTTERKALEQAMQRTLGRGLNQSVVTRLKSATNSLLNGDIKKWDQLFDDLPADMRQAAAAQALENIFFTAGKGTKISQSFVSNFNKIKRSPQLRDRLFDQLPMEARGQFMAIGEAANGFYRAMEKLNRSNTANAMQVVNAIEQPGFMNRVLGGAAEKGTRRIPVHWRVDSDHDQAWRRCESSRRW